MKPVRYGSAFSAYVMFGDKHFVWGGRVEMAVRCDPLIDVCG